MQINGYTIQKPDLSEMYCKHNHRGMLTRIKNRIICDECEAWCQWKTCCTCEISTWTDIECEYDRCTHNGCEACLKHIWKDCSLCDTCLCSHCFHKCEMRDRCPNRTQYYCNKHIQQCNEENCDNYGVYLCDNCMPIICKH